MTAHHATTMAREIAETPEAVDRLAQPTGRSESKRVASELRDLAPKAVITVARGSSDHAATYLSYAIQSVLRLPVASIGPSIHSVYGKDLRMKGLAALAISQSGSSDDIAGLCAAFRAGGGRVVALTNSPQSALANASSQVIDIAAGPELAVAATKSYFNSLIAGLWLIADCAEDEALAEALLALPACLRTDQDSKALRDAEAALAEATQTTIIARGAGLGLAAEFALKLLETCAMQASCYSGAEVLHGPSALLRDGYPVIALTTGAKHGLDQALDGLQAQGARVFALPPRDGTGHPLVDPLFDMITLYRLAERLSLARGLNPDAPPHLNKVTKTI